MFEQSKKNSKNPQKYFSKLFFIVFPPNLAHTKKAKYLHYHDPHTPFVCFSNKTFLFTRQKMSERQEIWRNKLFKMLLKLKINFFARSKIGNK